jgi:hypothetical protein
VRCQPAPRCNSRSTARACIALGAVLRRELAHTLSTSRRPAHGRSLRSRASAATPWWATF